MEQTVGRDSLRESVLIKYDLLKVSKEKATPFVVYQGVPGIGKTNLLQTHGYDVENTNGISFYISGKELGPREDVQATNYIDGASVVILRRIASRIDPGIIDPGYHDQIQTIDPNEAESLNNAFDMTADKLGTISVLNPVFIGLDDWDGRTNSYIGPIHSRIERKLLLPISRDRRANIVVAMATNNEVRFRQFEVRRLTELQRLGPLNHTDAGLLMESGHDRFLYSLTQGIPSLCTYLVNTYGVNLLSSLEGTAFAIQNKAAIARDLAEEIAGRVPELKDLELRRVFDFVSQFREFDVHLLRMLFSKLNPEIPVKSDSTYLTLLKKLIGTGQVQWNEEKRTYTMDPAIRRVFAHVMRFNDPEAYRAIHEAAIPYYAELVKDVPSNRVSYALEYVYHRALVDPRITQMNSYITDIFPYFVNDVERYTTFMQNVTHDDVEIREAFQGV